MTPRMRTDAHVGHGKPYHQVARIGNRNTTWSYRNKSAEKTRGYIPSFRLASQKCCADVRSRGCRDGPMERSDRPQTDRTRTERPKIAGDTP